jgi:hypothetical protein
MNTKCTGLFSISIFLLITNCSSDKTDYQFLKVDEIPIRLPEGQVVCRIFDIAQDARGRFYLADFSCHTIWVVNEQGYLITQIGSQGQGPGELAGPVSVAIRGDTLAVLEDQNHRISFFNLKGEFVYSFPLSGGQFSGIELSSGDELIVSESLGLQHFDFYSITGQKLSNHPALPATAVVMPLQIAGGQMSLADDGNILFSFLKKYEIVKMNWQGETLITYTASPPGYIAPDLSSREALMKQSVWALVGLPLQVRDRILVQWSLRDVRETGETSWKRFVDLFMTDGNPIQLAIPAPEYFLLAKSDLLYSVTDNAIQESGNPAIIVYRLLE